MPEIPFYATVCGRRFYEQTMPEIGRQLARIAAALEVLLDASEGDDDQSQNVESDPGT